MKVKIKITQEVDIKTLHVSAGVRYWEDSTVNGFEDREGDLIPCRNGDKWEPIIDIESGKILNWKEGTTADIHYKVCDDGFYELKTETGKSVAIRDGYVPHIMCPKENGFGDYIIMKIDADGKIANWDANLDDMIGDED